MITFIYSHGSLDPVLGPKCPGRTGGLLDLPVRTDTSNVVRYLGVSGVLGGVPGPYYPTCGVCGWPMPNCTCQD